MAPRACCRGESLDIGAQRKHGVGVYYGFDGFRHECAVGNYMLHAAPASKFVAVTRCFASTKAFLCFSILFVLVFLSVLRMHVLFFQLPGDPRDRNSSFECVQELMALTRQLNRHCAFQFLFLPNCNQLWHNL